MIDTWNPVVGDETIGLINHINLDDESSSRLVQEAKEILSLCGNPSENSSNRVGLAFGYVQSGKTLSFTTLSALARDNGYQMVIIIAGISTSLLNQSTSRLKNDLRLDFRSDRKWLGVYQTMLTPNQQNQMIGVVRDWKDDTYWEEDRKTIILTVMKNRNHLNNLIQTLELMDLESAPVLIIDDEGDQASLNTLERRNALNEIDRENYDSEIHLSTIHRQIDKIRSLCPHHSLVQYTATPQANLFVNILNRLSPDFLRLLTPGDSYTGGQVYFVNEPRLVRAIPSRDIPSEINVLHEAPDSLIHALQIFFLGVAYCRVTDEEVINRSMMIHPSRLKDDHSTYLDWVRGIKNRFLVTLRMDDDEDDKIELLAEFREAYNDIRETFPNIIDFSQIIGRKALSDALYHSINNTLIELVNSQDGKTPEVDWKNNLSYILVGGQSMARGFTVEGLTVTYMPRNVGVGNIDTIQQRARFFGYKSAYIGLCRVYLDQQTIDAYTHYVEHEELLRESLNKDISEGNNISDWNRTVILDRAYRIARNNIFSNVINRISYQDQWKQINYPHYNGLIIQENRRVVQQFITDNSDKFSLFRVDPRSTEVQTHLKADFRLEDIYNHLLLRYRAVQSDDSDMFTIVTSLVQNYFERNPNAMASVYQMSQGNTRVRAQNRNEAVDNYFQGSNESTGYLGDKFIKDVNRLSIQIHRLDIKRNARSNSPIEYFGVYGLCIWLPHSIGKQITKQGDDL